MSVQRVFADEDAASLTKDDIYSMLSNQRRRLTLSYLRRTDGTVSVRDLSKEVAALENEIERDELTYKQRKRVYTSLHQTHLPKLDDVGVVVYDRDRGTISLTPLATDLHSFLDATPDRRADSWSVYYLGLSGLSILAVGFAWSGLYPFTLLSGAGYAFLVAALFGVSAAMNVYTDRIAEAGDDRVESLLAEIGLTDDE